MTLGNCLGLVGSISRAVGNNKPLPFREIYNEPAIDKKRKREGDIYLPAASLMSRDNGNSKSDIIVRRCLSFMTLIVDGELG